MGVNLVPFVCVSNSIYTNTKYIPLCINYFRKNTQEVGNNGCLGRGNEECGWGVIFTVLALVHFFYHVHVTFPVEKKFYSFLMT